jgi:hypothetical protein
MACPHGGFAGARQVGGENIQNGSNVRVARKLHSGAAVTGLEPGYRQHGEPPRETLGQ